MTVWLARAGTLPSPPWQSSSSLLQCTGVVVNGSLVTCTIPAGTGTGWRVVVVNHAVSPSAEPVPADAPSAQWQCSTETAFTLSYNPPTIAGIASVGAARPAAGGFLLVITGANFGATPPLVTVGSLACDNVTSPPSASPHSVVTCAAPPRQLDDDAAAVVVTQGGLQCAAAMVPYDSPVVYDARPATLVAVVTPTARRSDLTVIGTNFGVRYRPQVAGNHTVTLSPPSSSSSSSSAVDCGAVQWVSDGVLVCTVIGDVAVGPYTVTVSINGQGPRTGAAAAVTVAAVCPPAMYGGAGEACRPCPLGARCDGAASDPVALPGYYPLSREAFDECAPAVACTGGVSAAQVQSGVATTGALDGNGTLTVVVTPCARNYMGVRCAVCAPGAYRLKGACVGCPNTAWLLFLLFFVAIVVLVGIAVYLSQKRINLAGLSIGVVSGPVCGCQRCCMGFEAQSVRLWPGHRGCG